jgi:hypothetical protein
MKHIPHGTAWTVLSLALAIGVPALPAQTGGGLPSAAAPSEADFPHLIPVETWLASGGFVRGDQITIRLVRGNRPRIEPGGTYLVLGTYTLASHAEATLALSLTASGAAGRGAWSPTQRRKIGQGRGEFALVAPMRSPGEFHVSFYIADRHEPRRSNAQGGIYFDNR